MHAVGQHCKRNWDEGNNAWSHSMYRKYLKGLPWLFSVERSCRFQDISTRFNVHVSNQQKIEVFVLSQVWLVVQIHTCAELLRVPFGFRGFISASLPAYLSALKFSVDRSRMKTHRAPIERKGLSGRKRIFAHLWIIARSVRIAASTDMYKAAFSSDCAKLHWFVRISIRPEAIRAVLQISVDSLDWIFFAPVLTNWMNSKGTYTGTWEQY